VDNPDFVSFDDLSNADLVIDRVYRGGTSGGVGDDALARLLPVGNQGGFRYKGSVKDHQVKLVALYTTGEVQDWPDALDLTTGAYTYYGDNRRPGKKLHETPREGNQLLSDVFEWTHADATQRALVPPFLLFEKTGHGRDIRFRGVLAPGSDLLSPEEDLVAVWRSTSGKRFQNYQSHFTVLDIPIVSRTWITQLLAGDRLGTACPPVWRTWVESRTYKQLLAPPTTIVRSKEEQQPTPADAPLLALVYEHFKDRPHDFEQFAADIWRIIARNVSRIDVTRPSRDGGRDAVGEYRIGPATDPVPIEFALEAKCYSSTNSVGVRETSRLISRLRHRQFGVLVTTSHVNKQAYTEIRDDGHPVVIMAGRDVVDALKKGGYDTVQRVTKHLDDAYPPKSLLSEHVHPVPLQILALGIVRRRCRCPLRAVFASLTLSIGVIWRVRQTRGDGRRHRGHEEMAAAFPVIAWP